MAAGQPRPMTSTTGGAVPGPWDSHQISAPPSRSTTATGLPLLSGGARAGAEHPVGGGTQDVADAEVLGEGALVELGDRGGVDHDTGLHEVRRVGERETERDVLLDEQHRDAARRDVAQDVAQLQRRDG